MSNAKSYAHQYLTAGKKLTLLEVNGKRPIVKNWTSVKIPEDKILNHYGNLGWALQPGDLVIDVDPKNKGDQSFAKLCRKLGIKFEKTVKTPSGGFHIYLTVPKKHEHVRFRKTLSEFPGVDFLTTGAQCVIVGSEIRKKSYQWAPENLLGVFEQFKAPMELLRLIKPTELITKSESNLGDFDGLIGSGTVSAERIFEGLKHLDSNCEYNEWIQIGMALHSWDPIQGFDYWDQWSKTSDKYKLGETKKYWMNFKSDGGITERSLLYRANSAKSTQNFQKLSRLINEASDREALHTTLPAQIKVSKLSDLDREQLAIALQKRIQEILGGKPPLGLVRKMVEKKSEGVLVNPDDSPAWCDDWLYIVSQGAFVHKETGSFYKKEAFNQTCGHLVPYDKNGERKQSAVNYTADRGFVRCVEAVAYIPWHNEYVYMDESERGSVACYNAFQFNHLPKTANEITKRGFGAIKRIRNHIQLICGDAARAEILEQWIAFQVQQPGRKILWSPIIQGAQGIGKSFFGELLRKSLGSRNVGIIKSESISSDFNGWATGTCVNVIEELHISGRNRFQVVNAIKPLITEPRIQINDKYVSQFTTLNTTNYICFTNRRDALPISVDDRRWWIIFSPIDSLDKLEFKSGEQRNDYFEKLWRTISEFGPEIRRWLLDLELTDEFMGYAQAPHTVEKDRIVLTQQGSVEWLNEVKNLVEKGGFNFCEEVVVSKFLFEQLQIDHLEDSGFLPKTTGRALLLKNLGYTAHSMMMNIQDKKGKSWKTMVWTKDNLDTNTIRKILEEHNSSLEKDEK